MTDNKPSRNHLLPADVIHLQKIADRDRLGVVSISQPGKITIQVFDHSISMKEDEYWRLMEMLSEASMRLMEIRQQNS